MKVLIISLLGCVALGVARADAQPRQKARAPARNAAQSGVDTTQQLEIYGFAQADMIFDFKQNDPNWFDVNRPTKLPSFTDQFGRDGRTWFSARQSALRRERHASDRSTAT